MVSKKIIAYVKLIRMKHYIKNILIFLPIVFGKSLFDLKNIIVLIMGFLSFSFCASAIYIFNDLMDITVDKKHHIKKSRPLASGVVSKVEAYILIFICICISTFFSILINNKIGFICLFIYVIINIFYSICGKHQPILDVAILATGFLLRIYYGGVITGIIISQWLYIVAASGSLFMGMGKRRNELKRNTETRAVLTKYTESFLDKFMYVFLTCAICFYVLWSFESDKGMWITIPIFVLILMRYCYDIEDISDGDPVEVILHDKYLLGILLLYTFAMMFLLYYVR